MSDDKAEHSPASMHRPSMYLPHTGWFQHEANDEVVQLLREGHFEAAEQAFCWCYLRPEDIVIDAGAHLGIYSLLAFTATQGRGHIHAFEPTPTTATLLRENLARNHAKSVTVVEAALWSTCGKLRLTSFDKGKSSHNFASPDPECGAIDVRAVTLDSYCDAVGIDHIDFVKIDTEGAETAVLEGAMQLLQRGACTVLLIEFTEANMQRTGTNTDALAIRIRSFGYSLYELDTATAQPVPFSIDGPIWYKNLLAVRDIAAVKARLSSVSPDQLKIAADILGRAQACKKFKELEELDGLRRQVAEVDGVRTWARKTEALLADQKQQSAEFEDWAHKAEARAAELSALIGVSQQRAQEAESRAADAETRATTNRNWAEQTEAHLAAAKEQAKAFEAWARKTEALLADQKQQSAEFEAWAHKAEARAAEAGKRAVAYRTWAENTERLLARERDLNKSNLAWAQRTESLLAADRESLASLKRDHGRLEDQYRQQMRITHLLQRYAAATLCLPTKSAVTTLWHRVFLPRPEISVILCTHNPNPVYLGQTLCSLAAQTLDARKWELIIVDNASTPRVEIKSLRNGLPANTRIIREPNLGLTNARIAGFSDARGQLFVCVDDDNILAPDYLTQALQLSKQSPELGAFGGSADPLFESPPAEWLNPILPNLALRHYGNDPITSDSLEWGPWEPIGAGMVVRRKVADAFVDFIAANCNARNLGRTGKNLMGAEDSLLARRSVQLGFKNAYRPELQLLHQIPARRVHPRYLKRLMFYQGRSFVLLKRLLGQSLPPVPPSFNSHRDLRDKRTWRINAEGPAGRVQWFWDIGYSYELTKSPERNRV